MEQKENRDLLGAESTNLLSAPNKEGAESAKQAARPALVRRGKLSPGLPKVKNTLKDASVSGKNRAGLAACTRVPQDFLAGGEDIVCSAEAGSGWTRGSHC